MWAIQSLTATLRNLCLIYVNKQAHKRYTHYTQCQRLSHKHHAPRSAKQIGWDDVINTRTHTHLHVLAPRRCPLACSSADAPRLIWWKMKMCDWLTFILFVSDDNLHLQFIAVIASAYYLPSLNGINVFRTCVCVRSVCVLWLTVHECGWFGVSWSVVRYKGVECDGNGEIFILRCPPFHWMSTDHYANEWNVNNELPKINETFPPIQLTSCCHTQTWYILWQILFAKNIDAAINVG